MRWKYLILGLPGLLIAVPAFYLLASIPGALVPDSVSSDLVEITAKRDKQIFLLSSPLHADIAIPVDDDVLRTFGFLKRSGIELDHPGLRYLIFGWGSKEFYTTAGSYSDITISATFKAITGDSSVMHVVPAGQIVQGDNSIALHISQGGFSRLLGFLKKSFASNRNNAPIWLENQSHGYGDVFYAGVGDFNILKPCNIWTGKALKIAGLRTGIWTPTTYGLRWALSIHN